MCKWENNGSTVFCNVYDLHWAMSALNGLLQDTASLGAFHVGIQVYGVEFMFAGESIVENATGSVTLGGIMRHFPKQHTVHAYRETIDLGKTRLSLHEVIRAADSMSEDWTGKSYHILNRNCIHFASALVARLQVDPIPERVTAGAEAARSFFGWMGFIPSTNEPKSERQESRAIVDGIHVTTSLEKDDTPSRRRRNIDDYCVPERRTHERFDREWQKRNRLRRNQRTTCFLREEL